MSTPNNPLASILVLILSFCTCLVYGQEVLRGQVLSHADGQPIPFANLSLTGTFFGTSANKNGEFVIKMEDIPNADSLVVSAVGFGKKALPVKNILQQENVVIYLEEKTTLLGSVTVTKGKLKEKVIGKTKAGDNLGRMMGKNPGAQYGRKFVTHGKNMLIREVSTFVSCVPDSVTLRLRIYTFENNRQGEELLNQNVFVEVGQTHGWVSVDLSSLEIWTDRDFIIGFEWLNNDFGYPMIGVGGMSSQTYFRLASHDDWKPITNMNWAINATVWVE